MPVVGDPKSRGGYRSFRVAHRRPENGSLAENGRGSGHGLRPGHATIPEAQRAALPQPRATPWEWKWDGIRCGLKGRVRRRHGCEAVTVETSSDRFPANGPDEPMSNHSQQIVQKLWNYCNVLRDDGLSYGDYVEQLTFLLFLKMAHERTQPPWNQASAIPREFDWPSLMKRDGDELETHYRHLLEELGKRPGMLGIIFRKAQNKIQDPAKLRRLIADLINKEQWTSLDADVKGDAYEGLLEKNAQDTKGGAGQYFTPRPLIQAIVDVIRPQPGQAGQPGETICDPACGTGGFLLAAHDFIARHFPNLDRDQKRHLKLQALRGVELVDAVTRLCAMNLLLHGIGPSAADEAEPPVQTNDSLAADPGTRFEVVMTNPPFGKKSSVMVVNEEGEQESRRSPWCARTSGPPPPTSSSTSSST